MAGPEPGWYKESETTTDLRWWDGSAWSEHRKPLGQTTQMEFAGTWPGTDQSKLRPVGLLPWKFWPTWRKVTLIVLLSILAMILLPLLGFTLLSVLAAFSAS